MLTKFWIFLVVFGSFYFTDIQSVSCQRSSSQYQLALQSLSNIDGIQVSSTFNKSGKTDPSYPSILVARPIANSKKQLAKINTTNWIRINENNLNIQKITIEQIQQVYIRLDRLILQSNDYLQIIDLDKGILLDELTSDSGKPKYLAGPYVGKEFGIVVYSSNRSVLDDIEIGEIYIGAMEFGYDSSFECHKNINCDEGENFNQQKRAVTRITMVLEEGIGFCTGSLVNNTSQNREPYLLSAFHCQDGYTPIYDMWSFDFGYESFSCANPDSEPNTVKITGCERVAGYGDSDMLLLKITTELTPSTNAYFSGWNRDDSYNPQGAVLIHHPRGDIKKITVENDQVVPYSEILPWDNGIRTSENSHYVTRFDGGTYQGGSSGAPLLDNEGKIIGQLHGGPEDDSLCSVGIGYHGRFSLSWEGGGSPESRLKDWLDPNGQGVTIMDGIEFNDIGSTFISFVGRLVTPDGIAIPNVEVSINGDKEETFKTGSDGRFAFDNLPKSGIYTLQFKKNTNHGNGVSALDLVQIMNHILDRNPLRGVFQQRSADANNDGKVSSLDLVQVLNVIIGRADAFPNNTSWQFEPSIIEMNEETFNSNSLDRQIIGYKIGDVNFSANPRR